MLAGTARAVGFEATREHLLPLLACEEPGDGGGDGESLSVGSNLLVADGEFVVRQHLALQLPGLAALCCEEGGEAGYDAMVRCLVPVAARLGEDPQPEVRAAAGEALVSIADRVADGDLVECVLMVLLRLAHEADLEDLRTSAASLANKLSSRLGEELCQQWVIPEIISLSEDPVFRVRKAAALNLDEVFRAVGPECAVTRLMPAYLKLCADEIWGVRKACAESLVSVAESVPKSVRATQLVDVLEAFLKDVSKWVRHAMYQQLGPFLSTMPSELIPAPLLAHFTGMAADADNPDGGEAELALFCAFSYPGVMVTLGCGRWPELRATFNVLVRNANRKVRRTLAHSLHEIAAVSGAEIAEAELLVTFDLFMKDLDEVKVGVIRNLAAFLACLTPGCRESYLPILSEIQSGCSPMNWRFRNWLAMQMPEMSVLFSAAATFSVVVPLSLKLLKDPVFCVRRSTLSCVAPLLRRLGLADRSWQEDFAARLIATLSECNSCFSRQMYVLLCDILQHETGIVELYEKAFLPPLLALASDPVANVRIVLCQVLKNAPEGATWHGQVVDARLSMHGDRDYDVAHFAGGQPQRRKNVAGYLDQLAADTAAASSGAAEPAPAAAPSATPAAVSGDDGGGGGDDAVAAAAEGGGPAEDTAAE